LFTRFDPVPPAGLRGCSDSAEFITELLREAVLAFASIDGPIGPARPDKILRVLFFEPYPMGLGGNFQTQLGLLRFLSKGKFNPIVVAPQEGIALDRFRAIGIECAVVSPPNSLARYGGQVLRSGVIQRTKSIIDLFRYNLRLARFFREHRIDVVYANCVRAAMCVGLAAKLARCPMLLYVKGALSHPIIDQTSFLLADRILFFCESNRDDKYSGLVRRLHKKIGILKIGLNPDEILDVERRDTSAVRGELEIDPGRVNAIVLGQLYRPKGQHFAIEALADVVKDFPNVCLYIVGDEVIKEYRAYKDELLALVRRHGLQNHVRFTGWHHNALDLIAQMDIVIHPSLAEGFGRAVLESMALGRPVIASRVGGLREAIKDGQNGFLVDPGDIEGIARRWRELLASKELRLRLGQEARRTVFTEYLLDDKLTRFAEILGELTEESR
jgi:glycosyltransferase involved in cell wall biosynthesis